MTGYMKIFRLLPALILTVAACSDKGQKAEMQYSFTLESTSITLRAGDSAKLGIRSVIDGISFGSYDFTQDKLKLAFSSSDEEIATVDADGTVTAVANGKCEISVTSKLTWYVEKAYISVGISPDISSGALVSDVHTFSQDLSQALDAENINMPTGILNSAQGLDIDKDGNRFVSYESDGSVCIARVPAGGSKSDAIMTCRFGGHGDGFCVENTTDGVYVWTVGSMGEDAGYSGGKANSSDVRLVCRYKYQAGKTVFPEDAIDRFYINDNGARCMSVDLEHGQFGIWTYSGGDQLHFYNYEDVLNAPYRTLTVTRTERKADSVKAHDLSKLTPLGKFSWDRKVYCGVSNGSTNAVQGFCIYDSKAYILSGYKNDAYSTISIADIGGSWLATRSPVGVSSDKQKLMDLDLSGDGTWEPEGVQIHFGRMYLVNVGDYSVAPKKRVSIVELR